MNNIITEIEKLDKEVDEAKYPHPNLGLLNDLGEFMASNRQTIIRMLRAGEKMATTIEGELHSPKCHLNSSRPFGSKLREEWDAKGCDCWKSVLKEYQTAKESI